MAYAHGTSRAHFAKLEPLGLILLSPLIVTVSPAILLVLLGVFVLWLAIVGVLVAAIVISDLAHRTMRRFARLPAGAPARRAVGYPGH